MNNTDEKISLFAKGPLGTCWYGKYHYLEPWAGCEHSCPYCYARSRNAVKNTLNTLGTQFDKPKTLLPEASLLEQIENTANSGEISVLKLSRYTDIFTPFFVQNGLAYKVLEILAKSKIKRIIITTKGIPCKKTLELLEKYKEKFSYNAAARPSATLAPAPLHCLDKNLLPLDKRLDTAAKLALAGLKVSIHMDPMVANIDDTPHALDKFFNLLKDKKLNRVMFSYLLFSEGMMGAMRKAMPEELLSKIMADYDFSGSRSVLPNQEDTSSQALKNEIIKGSVIKVADELERRGFDFVLCSLKSVKGFDRTRYKKNMICDGTFYA